MCGRYANASSREELNAQFDLAWEGALSPHYNIAPSQIVAIVRAGESAAAHEEQRELAFVKWGLIPSWAKEPDIGVRLINARAETLAEKPAFRNAWRRRHCLVPASAFYEWKGPPGHKQPWCIRMADGAPFGMAGLWERWKDPSGHTVETCTIITTEANALVAKLHDRMPLIIPRAEYAAWLASANPRAAELIRPFPAELMRAWPVSTRVNKVGNDDPACMEAVEGAGGAREQ
jgi:putative SOS response-associated peptidase YedK